MDETARYAEGTISKLLYSGAMPLDGFIAGVGGDTSSLTDHLVLSQRLRPKRSRQKRSGRA